MYDCVPNLSTEREYPFLNSLGLVHKLKSKMFDDDELMELVWQNGEVVFNNQNQKNTTHNGGERIAPLQQSTNNQLFIHEDEMASWLLPYPASRTTTANPSVHPQLISNNPTITSVGPVTRTTTTVIGSNETPTTTEFRDFSGERGSGGRVSVTSGDSGLSISAELPPRPPKRKSRPKSEFDSEEIEQDVPNAKKQVHGSPSSKRSRATEVHNLLERKRRDRINAKMKTLQDLIPRCNKMDKASMLDDAIEYLKSLQQTVQMMSMGYGIVPVMYPGVQSYVPSMPMGMNVGTSINRPMINQPIINQQVMPYPIQAPISSERPLFPAFHLHPASVSENPIIHTTSHPDPLLNFQVPNEQQISNFRFYQQYLGAQAALAQNQVAMQQKESKPKTISEAKSHDDTHYSG